MAGLRENIACRLRRYAEKDGRGYPDWAMRYLPVLRRLRRMQPGGRPLEHARVLEIGANEAGFARFSGTPCLVVDRAIAHLKAARRATPGLLVVAADIAALPFRRASVDACVCLDTFEHLPAQLYAPAVENVLAVVKPEGVAVVGFPSGDAAARAEASIRAAYASYTGGGTLHWLEEHATCGLPEARHIVDLIAQTSRRVIVGKNASLWAWRWAWRVLMCGWPGRGNALFQAVLRLATPVLSRVHAGPCYRTMVWVEPAGPARPVEPR